MSRTQIPEYLYFRSDRFFYPFVTSFFASLAGLQALVDPRNPMEIKPNQRLPVQGQVHKQFSINTFELFQHLQSGKFDYSFLTAQLCCMLTNTAYELVKDQRLTHSYFKFFRHIRNASSHGNRFFFKPNQPDRTVDWREKTISNSAKGAANPLFQTTCFFGYLGPADLILLLWDIEQLVI